MKRILRPARKALHLSTRVISKAQNISAKVEQKVSNIIDQDGSLNANSKVKAINDIVYSFHRGLYNCEPISPALPKLRGDSVNLFVPTIDSSAMFGGIATAIRVAEKIATKTNRSLRFVCVDRPGNIAHAQTFLKSIGSPLELKSSDMIDVSGRKGVHYGYIDLRPDDVNIATAWWTAQQLSRMQLKQPFIYIIQDFEPIFYNYSDLYVFAKQTYEQGNYIALFNTNLVRQYLKSKGFEHAVRNAVVFEPAVDRSLFYPRDQKNEKKKIFIYGRPNVARNLYIHALNIVDQAFTEKILISSEWDVFIAGDEKAPSILLNSGVIAKNVGKLKMNQYAEIAGTTDLAISLMMAPHPSYPPLELASSGSTVVTSAYDIKTDLSMYSDNIFVAQLNSFDMMAKIKEAISLTREERLKNVQNNKLTSNWDDALSGPIDELIAKLKLS